MKNLAVLVTSRNNYELLDKFWAPNIRKIKSTEGLKILNIDEDSSDSEKKLGKAVCNKYGIDYLDREERGIANNILTAAKYCPEAKYIIWFQSDCWPIQDNFFSDFGKERR